MNNITKGLWRKINCQLGFLRQCLICEFIRDQIYQEATYKVESVRSAITLIFSEKGERLIT